MLPGEIGVAGGRSAASASFPLFSPLTYHRQGTGLVGTGRGGVQSDGRSQTQPSGAERSRAGHGLENVAARRRWQSQAGSQRGSIDSRAAFDCILAPFRCLGQVCFRRYKELLGRRCGLRCGGSIRPAPPCLRQARYALLRLTNDVLDRSPLACCCNPFLISS